MRVRRVTAVLTRRIEVVIAGSFYTDYTISITTVFFITFCTEEFGRGWVGVFVMYERIGL
jgi:hypothetical protein